MITVNRRLARVLRERHCAARAGSRLRVWETPDVVPWMAWLERLWQELCERRETDVPALLGAEQELALWEQVVAEHARGEHEAGLLQRGAAARAAREAWALLAGWRLSAERDLGGGGEETRVFAAWARDYRERCREAGWTDHASLAGLVARDVRAAMPARLEEIVLVGFDDPTPQQRALFAALAAAGVTVRSAPPPALAARARRTSFASEDEEVHAAARWARARVEQGDTGPVGVVVPDLDGRRERVERIFLDVLHPGHARPGAAETARAFNISLGRPLTRVALASDALLALGTLRARLPLGELGRLLLSPYLDLGELGSRARLDAELRRIGEPEWRLASLPAWIRRIAEAAARGAPRRADPATASRLVDVVARVLARVESLPARQPVAQWAGTFAALLDDLGWPGPRALSSHEFQSVEAVHDLLAELAALGPVLPDLALGQALSQLERLAGRTVFQAQSPPAPVQVLGMLEASGIEYSALWLSGLHDVAWPEPPRPNPFLPAALQRAHGMPRASPEVALRRASTWTKRMLASAPEVIASHARRLGEEPLGPSALVAHLPELESAVVPVPAAPGEAHAIHAEAPPLERIDDERAPALAPHAPVRGGAAVLGDQSACPFRAFALHRLGAGDVAAPASAVDARVRGTVAHRLLELLWRRIETHAGLVALSADERARVIAESVREALESEAWRRPVTLRGRMLALERARLEAMAEAWLAIEAARAPFRVTAERGGEARIGGLTLGLRPDRVDRTAGGDLVVIDYKTGQCGPSQWLGARPEEPQLPFYAVALESGGTDRVAGIAFAVLRSGELRFAGVGAEEDLLPGVDELSASRGAIRAEASDWAALMELWRTRLEALGVAFAAGDARVDPREPGITCRYCGLQPLCRVHEKALGAGDE
ncbi:MAG: PD-(D/E)XK nuclease family protein [Burkholderiales bacterium]|nr:PD-(D/E)XK nuclease family protein [Burkholderiales bacterium]